MPLKYTCKTIEHKVTRKRCVVEGVHNARQIARHSGVELFVISQSFTSKLVANYAMYTRRISMKWQRFNKELVL